MPAPGTAAPATATDRKLDILVVVGTRPEAIKLVPVILALEASDAFRPVVISTGQHHSMVNEVMEAAGIAIDAVLWAGSGGSGLNELVPSVIRNFEGLCAARYGTAGPRLPSVGEVGVGRRPCMVLVHGDTSSAMAAAIAAFHLRIPVAHIEAGLRTGDSVLEPFPEELNRQAIGRIACFHFAPTTLSAENLIRERIPYARVFVTGNTAIDALQWASALDIPLPDARLRRTVAEARRVVVITAHRRENWDGGLSRIAEATGRLAERHPDVEFVLPLHPNPKVREQLGAPLETVPNAHLTDPLPYLPFAGLLKRSDLVITDSGGIQEEAPSLGKPVIVTRDRTERTEGLRAGTLDLAGSDPKRIADSASALLDDPVAYRRMAEAGNPYGDGQAAERIVAALTHIRFGGDPPLPFGPGYDRSEVLRVAGYPPQAIARTDRDSNGNGRDPRHRGVEGGAGRSNGGPTPRPAHGPSGGGSEPTPLPALGDRAADHGLAPLPGQFAPSRMRQAATRSVA